jgi:large subunit ribosomal protein L9
MKVILRQDVEKVGLRGEVVDVARGFARNYLLPRQLAEPATDSRVAELEKVSSHRARHEAQDFEQAQEIAQRLGQAEIRFDVKAGETGVLFGSVTQTQLADAIWEKLKVRVDRRKIELDEPLKRIGRYQVPIELFPEVTVPTRVLVVPEGGELPPEEQLQAIEEAEAAEVAASEAAAEAEHAEAEALIEQELEPEPEEGQEGAEGVASPSEAGPAEAPGAAEQAEPEGPIEQEPAPEAEEVQEEPGAASPPEATAAEESREQA